MYSNHFYGFLVCPVVLLFLPFLLLLMLVYCSYCYSSSIFFSLSLSNLITWLVSFSSLAFTLFKYIMNIKKLEKTVNRTKNFLYYSNWLNLYVTLIIYILNYKIIKVLFYVLCIFFIYIEKLIMILGDHFFIYNYGRSALSI